MLFFGHLGIGSKIVSPWSERLPLRMVLLGTILPDIIDKPLYFVPALLTGKIGADLGLISCSRTFGHTALFLLALALASFAWRSKSLAALALGVGTHLLLDNLTDSFHPNSNGSALMAMLWPFLDTHFAAMPDMTREEYLQRASTPFILGGEAMGLAILGWDLWKRRHESEIVAFFKKRRSRRGRDVG